MTGAGPRPAWRGTLGHALVLAAAVAIWLVSLALTHVDQIGEYGLLATVHPAFFAALALVVTGFCVELARDARRGPVLIAYTLILILIIHATAPLLLSEAQYAWTFKHVGVIELFASRGRVIDDNDIYQQWPAFFTAAAQISGASGVDALALAKWAPVFFNLGDALILWAVARTLSPDRRVAYLTVFAFECLNWVEQDYLSPQGFAFLLSLGMLLIALRWLRADQTRRVQVVALVALVAVLAVITAAHQLTPYLMALDLILLVLLGPVRPWPTGLIALAIPVLYLLPRLHLVAGSFGIFESFDFFRNASGTSATWGTPGQAFSAIVVRLLSLVVWLLAALAVLRQRHELRGLFRLRRRPAPTEARRRVIVPAILALAPFTLLLAQSYGGEAIYRVYLFSVPWCAFLIADQSLTLRGRGLRAEGTSGSARAASVEGASGWAGSGWAGSARIAIAAVLLVVAVLATLQGRNGQLMVDRQTKYEVEAAQYLYAHATPGATIVLGTPNFPSRISANYGDFNRSVAVGEPDLVKGALLQHVNLNDTYLPAIEIYARSFDGAATYLVLSRGMKQYVRYFGYLPNGSLDLLASTLNKSPQWTLWYQNPDVLIFQMRG